jgi:signal transduction histidine kinase
MMFFCNGAYRASSPEAYDYLNEILELTQIEEGEVPIVSQQISLKNTLQNCVDMYLPALKEQGVDFVFDYETSLPEEWLTDDFRLKRIVINLLGNAIKFTPSGSIHLTVGLAALHTQEHHANKALIAI